MVQLKHVDHPLEVAPLRSQILDCVNEQVHSALRLWSGGDEQLFKKASLLLCAFVDETVLKLEWAGNEWNRLGPLSNSIHGTNQAGEQIFQDLNEALQNVQKHYELLLLYYHVLSLGFLGKYARESHGKTEVEQKRQALFNHLRLSGTTRIPEYGDLKTSVPPVSRSKRFLFSAWPLGLWALSLLLVAGLAYGLIRADLNERSDEIQILLSQLVPELKKRQRVPK